MNNWCYNWQSLFAEVEVWMLWTFLWNTCRISFCQYLIGQSPWTWNRNITQISYFRLIWGKIGTSNLGIQHGIISATLCSVILPHKQGFGNDDKNPDTPQREMVFLRQILGANVIRDMQTYRSILQHPIVHVFTDIKWDRLKALYFLYLAFQVNILIWYVLFLFLLIFVDCPVTSANPSFHFNGTALLSSVKGNTQLHFCLHVFLQRNFAVWILILYWNCFIPDTLFSSSQCDIRIYTRLIAIYVLFCTTVSAFKEVYHFATDFWSYIVDIFNYAQWIGIATMATTCAIALDPIELFHFWLFPLASVRFHHSLSPN